MKVPFFRNNYRFGQFIYLHDCSEHGHGGGNEKTPPARETKEKKRAKARQTVKKRAAVRRKHVAKRVAVHHETQHAMSKFQKNAESMRRRAKTSVDFYMKDDKVNVRMVQKMRSIIPVKILIALQKVDHDIIKKVFCPAVKKLDGKIVRQFQTFGNREVLYKIGLTDVYRYDAALRKIRVYNPQRNKDRVGTRTGYAGNFYTSSKRYCAILQDDLIVEIDKWDRSRLAREKTKHENTVQKTTAAIAQEIPNVVKKLPQDLYTPRHLIQARGFESSAGSKLQGLAKNEYLQKRTKLIKSVVDEAIRQGVEPKFMLAVMMMDGIFANLEINLRQLRWKCTNLRTDMYDYQRRTSHNAKDSRGMYQLEFLAYWTKLRGVPSGQTFAVFRNVYQKLIGRKLEGPAGKQVGDAQDVKYGRELVTRTIRRGRRKKGESVAEVLYRRPKFRMVWDQISQKLRDNNIPFEVDLQRQDGSSLLFLGDRMFTLFNDATIRAMKVLRDKNEGWKLQFNNLGMIHRYASMPYLAKYRQKTREKFRHGSLKDALVVLREAPGKHVRMHFKPRSGLTSPYSYRNAIPRVGVRAGLHRALDISQGNGYPMRVSFPCRVVSLRRYGKNMGRTVYMVVETRDHNGDLLRFGFAHMQSGSIPAHIRPGMHLPAGTYIGREGNTGRSTAPHTHFWVKKKSAETGYRWMYADAFAYVDRGMQERIYRKRLSDPTYRSKFIRILNSSRRYRNTLPPLTIEEMRNILYHRS